jgi:hypothetical protein
MSRNHDGVLTFRLRDAQGDIRQNEVHATEARSPCLPNRRFATQHEQFAKAKVPSLSMCTPSKRERRFALLQNKQQFREVLKLSANTSSSQRRNEHFEK